ncbi:MAG: LytTR family transcriptional regulator [Acidobacteria bacterium]|nr:LytTR family transcriptional regulator [Acidobacteriota bacterium]
MASIVADGELLHLTNLQNKKYTINFRLKDIEARLEPNKFVRLSRGALVNLEMIARINSMPGGTYQVTLKNGQEIASSRLQSRVLREQLLKL